MIQEANGGWTPSTEKERGEVLAELGRILGDSHFKNSRRYPHFLRYVVEETLRGAGDQLKERNLGIIIFDRPPDYDTNSDSIVRVTAAEIRRRLAQYYDQPTHVGELRIDLPPGSYTPQFSRRLPDHPAYESQADAVESAAEAAVPALKQPVSQSSFRRLIIPFLIVASISAGLGVALSWLTLGRNSTPALNEFWHFEGNRQKEILLCVGQVDPWAELQKSAPGISIRDVTNHEKLLTVGDSSAAALVASTVTSVGLMPFLIGSTAANFTDLQRGPTVLIGAFNNDWTARLTEHLPYLLVRPDNGEVFQIIDTKASTPKIYQMNMTMPYTQFTQDYGIVARYVSSVTNQPTFLVGGIAANGTAAATQLVTSELLFSSAIKSLPPDWRKKNIEILLATQVIDGKTGPPKILGVRTW